MGILSTLAAAGVWPAVPIAGHFVFALPQRVSEGGKIPAVATYALTAAAGLVLWSVPLLAAVLAGVYYPAVLGLLGWSITAVGLASAFWRNTRHEQLAAARREAGTRETLPVSPPKPTARRSRDRRTSGGEQPVRRHPQEAPLAATSTGLSAGIASSDVIWDALLIAGLVVAAALYFGFPTESIYGGRDEGVYANQAIYIAQHGRRDVPYPWPKDADAIFAAGWSGFPGLYNTAGEMTPQFSQVFSAWLAQAFATFGHHGLFRLNAVFALLSLAVFYGLCVIAVGRPYAVSATLFLAFNPSQLWMARITLSEILTQLFIWSSLLVLMQALSQGRPSLARWAGVFVGCAALVRFDALILVPLLFVAHAAFTVLIAANDSPGGATEPSGRGAPDVRVWRALYQTALPSSVVAVAYYAVFSTPYFDELGRYHLTKLVVVTLAAVLVLLASMLPFVRRLRPGLTSKPLLTALCVALFGLVAYAYWLRPTASAQPAWKHEPLGLSVDVSRDYRQDSVVNLARYVSLPVIPAAIAGWLLCVWVLARQRRNPHLTPLLTVIAGCAAIYLWDPAVHPDHYWAVRRFVPVVIPGFVVCAALGMHGGTRRLPALLARGVEGLALVFLTLFTLNAGQLIFTFAEYRGYFRQIEELARKLPTDQVVLTHGYKTWVTPLYVAFDRKVVPLDLNSDKGHNVKEEWVARQARHEEPVYTLVEVDQRSPNSAKVAEVQLLCSYTEPTTNPLPQRILTVSRQVELYEERR